MSRQKRQQKEMCVLGFEDPISTQLNYITVISFSPYKSLCAPMYRDGIFPFSRVSCPSINMAPSHQLLSFKY